MTWRPLPLAPLLLLAGCAGGQDGYPSLAKRPIEGRGFAEPVVAAAVATPDPALDAKVAALSDRLTASNAGFDRVLGAAQATVRSAGKARVGSDVWLDAQTALAAVDEAHAETTSVASEADTLASDRAAALQPAYPALDALRARLQAAVDRENAAMAALQGGIAPA